MDVMHLIAQWTDRVMGSPASPSASIVDEGRTQAWGLQRLGPGVWNVEPSIPVYNSFHAFVTIIGVPEPAPFVPIPDRREPA